MLDQLAAIYREYATQPAALLREPRIWQAQHCVDADDIAFQFGCALGQYAARTTAATDAVSAFRVEA